MESYDLDVAPEQIVRWLLAEQRAGRADFTITASRTYETAEIPEGKRLRLGDAEREDIGELVEIGSLEVSPLPGHGKWTLRIEVADDIGPRLPEDSSLPQEEEEIDLQTFHDEFVAKERGVINARVTVADAAAKGQFTRMLDAILKNRHRG